MNYPALHESTLLASVFAAPDKTTALRRDFARAIADVERAATAWHEARNDVDANAALDREASARCCATVIFKQLTGLEWERVEGVMR